LSIAILVLDDHSSSAIPGSLEALEERLEQIAFN